MADVGAVLRFRHQLREVGRLMWLSVQLAWRASPRLALGVLLLLLVQALLPSLNLVLYRLVLDRAALGLGHGTVHDPLAAHLSLLTWIACAAVGVVLAQLLQLVAATLQTMSGDRLTAYVTGQVIRAANRWPGLARFEDPTFADDLHRTRTAASRGGLSIMVHGATGLMHLVTVVGASLVLLHLHPFVPVLLLLASLPAMARQWEYVC